MRNFYRVVGAIAGIALVTSQSGAVEKFPPMSKESTEKVTTAFQEIESSDFDIAAHIAESNSTSLEDLLYSLPKEFSIDPILIYRTRSAQLASSLSPRVVLKNKNQSTLIAFETKKPRTQEIEFIQYDKDSGKYNFGLIVRGSGGWKIDQSVATQKFCASCHSGGSGAIEDLRPNWSQYNIWEGVFGSRIHEGRGRENELAVAAEKTLLAGALNSVDFPSEFFKSLPLGKKEPKRISELLVDTVSAVDVVWERMVQVNSDFTSTLHYQTYHRLALKLLKLIQANDSGSSALEELVRNNAISDDSLQRAGILRPTFDRKVDEKMILYEKLYFSSLPNQLVRNVKFIDAEFKARKLEFNLDDQLTYLRSKMSSSVPMIDSNRRLDFFYRAQLDVFLNMAYKISLKNLMPVFDEDQQLVRTPLHATLKNTLPLFLEMISRNEKKACSATFNI